MAKDIFPSAGRKDDVHISRVASGNSLFTTQKIDLYHAEHMKILPAGALDVVDLR